MTTSTTDKSMAGVAVEIKPIYGMPAHQLAKVIIKGRVYAAVYGEMDEPLTEALIRRDLASYGYGHKAGRRGFLPYNESAGRFV